MKLKEEIEQLRAQRTAEALAAEGGNQTNAARRLGVSRRSLLYYMQRYGLTGPREFAIEVGPEPEEGVELELEVGDGAA